MSESVRSLMRFSTILERTQRVSLGLKEQQSLKFRAEAEHQEPMQCSKAEERSSRDESSGEKKDTESYRRTLEGRSLEEILETLEELVEEKEAAEPGSTTLIPTLLPFDVANELAAHDDGEEASKELQLLMEEQSNAQQELTRLQMAALQQQQEQRMYKKASEELTVEADKLRKQVQKLVVLHDYFNRLLQDQAETKQRTMRLHLEHTRWREALTEEDEVQAVVLLQCIARCLSAKKLAQKLASRDQQRSFILKELYDSEKRYVDLMANAISLYVIPLRAACKNPVPVISEEDIEQIFGNLEELHLLHASFALKLEKVLKTLNRNTCVGDIFLEIKEPCKKIYSTYSSTRVLAATALDSLITNNIRFKAFAANRQEEQVTRYLRINDALIAPIQRIPRYALLLRDLIRQTEECHPDYEPLMIALRSIDIIAETMNSSTASSKGLHQLLAVEKCIATECRVAQLNRKLVFEGPAMLSLKGRKDGRAPGHMVLFSDLLLLCVHRHSPDDTVAFSVIDPSNEGALDLFASLPLAEVTIKDVRTSKAAFSICAQEHTIVVRCKHAPEQKVWVDIIGMTKDGVLSS